MDDDLMPDSNPLAPKRRRIIVDDDDDEMGSNPDEFREGDGDADEEEEGEDLFDTWKE